MKKVLLLLLLLRLLLLLLLLVGVEVRSVHEAVRHVGGVRWNGLQWRRLLLLRRREVVLLLLLLSHRESQALLPLHLLKAPLHFFSEADQRRGSRPHVLLRLPNAQLPFLRAQA
jgi:hypothetical protein